MTHNLRLRPMTPADKPAIMQVLKGTPEFTPAEVTIAEEVIDTYLGDPKGSGYYVLVAEIDSSLAGYICYGPVPMTQDTWDIYWIAVLPESQRLGIGKSLLSSAEERIRKARGRMALIETSSTKQYEKARQFYRSQGYELASIIDDFYSPGDDGKIFKKLLL
ncbi:MAG: GNAT family N-acetyltransferase [Chloroflexi bacterium]|nr:GNAT family N-acetyltransferase [Chloroflexota bacterium]